MSLHTTAKNIFLETLHHVRVSEVMQHRVRCEHGILHAGELSYPLEPFHRVAVIAVGKAAGPMADHVLGQLAGTGQQVDAIIVGSTAPTTKGPAIQFFAGSHPFPNQTARDAADAILALLAAADAGTLVLYLISGGASAMIEKALNPAFNNADEIEFHWSLVQSGLPILEMNALRKHFSQVKGGRLAVVAGEATQSTLVVSDVPEDKLHVIGSGPSLPDPSTVDDCRELLRLHADSLRFNEKLTAFFLDPNLAETPKPDDPAFEHAAWISLLSSADLCLSASEAATRAGFHVVVDNSCDDWPYQDAAAYLLGRLEQLRTQYPKACVLFAGEISVQLPLVHGKGGRNQQFALECARLITEEGSKVTVLSGGSDGIDGHSPAAGAVSDETTLARATAAGFDPLTALANIR